MPSLIYMIGLASRNWNCRRANLKGPVCIFLYQAADVEIYSKTPLYRTTKIWKYAITFDFTTCRLWRRYTAGQRDQAATINFVFPIFAHSSLHLFASQHCLWSWDELPVPREILVNSHDCNHIESFLRVPDVWVDTNIFHRWIQQKDAVSSPERPLGEISMLVSACRKIVSATSAVLCGFLFALRTYLCERPSSSFRPLHLLFQLLLPFLFLFFSSSYLFFFLYYNRGGRFYLGTLQMIRFDSINL